MTTATVRCALAQYKQDVRSRFRPVRHRAGQRFVERICGRYSVPVDPAVAGKGTPCGPAVVRFAVATGTELVKLDSDGREHARLVVCVLERAL